MSESPDNNISETMSSKDSSATADDIFQIALTLDHSGFFPAGDEDAAAFLQRVERLHSVAAETEQLPTNGVELGKIVGFSVGEVSRMSKEIKDEAAEITMPLFAFRSDWVPAFFPKKGIGMLWGGCTVETESGNPIFFLRNSFAKRKRWFIYNRSELLAHELCHAVRGVLHDNEYEEHFAYMTSSSAFRRWMGNCFQHEWDAIVFTAPVFLLLLAQILIFSGVLKWPIYPFWILAMIWPIFLVVRNIHSRNIYFRTYHKLEAAGFSQVQAVMFRMTSEEIHMFSRLSADELRAKLDSLSRQELRWRIITSLFQTGKDS